MTKSTYWLRGGQGKATIGLVSEEGEHYQQGNTGDEEKRKINPPIAVAITRISECWELLLLPPGLLPPRVPLCPPPLPSIWKILTPSLTLTFLWHLPSTPPFTWLLKSLPSRWQTFLKPLTSEQSFSHFHLGHRLLPMSQDQRSDEANWSPRETESNWLPAAPTGVAVTRSFSEWYYSVFYMDTI